MGKININIKIDYSTSFEFLKSYLLSEAKMNTGKESLYQSIHLSREESLKIIL